MLNRRVSWNDGREQAIVMRKQILYLRRGASEQDENRERKKLRHCEQGAASVSTILFFFKIIYV